MNIFITGTDTDVGKTIVTAGLAAVMQSLGYDMGVYKPVQSGCLDRNGFYLSPDLQAVKSIDPNVKTKCTYNLLHPVAPSLAAELENVDISMEEILADYEYLKDINEMVIVEGAGGLLVPVRENLLISDLIKYLNLPLIIVARPDLGTINHTLLTIRTAQNLGIDVRGVIINKYNHGSEDPAIKTAPQIIEKLSGVKILGLLPEIEYKNNMINPELLIGEVIKNIDIQSVFGIEIPKLSPLI